MKLLEVEGTRAPVPHSWRRHSSAQTSENFSTENCSPYSGQKLVIIESKNCHIQKHA